MDLIEKCCCWKYIFVQLNAGCLKVPHRVRVYKCGCLLGYTEFFFSVFTVVHDVYLKSKILLFFVSVDRFPVGALTQLKDKMVS